MTPAPIQEGRSTLHRYRSSCALKRNNLLRALLLKKPGTTQVVTNLGQWSPENRLSMANYQISLNVVVFEVLIPLPGCATSSSYSFI
jgi:hypothetical protein